jgi:hypothetical protein
MKTLLCIFISFLSIVCFSQTTVTGHIYAEIVESLSINQKSQTSFFIQRDRSNNININQLEISNISSSLIVSDVKFKSINDVFYLKTKNTLNGYNIDFNCQTDKLIFKDNYYDASINIILSYN